jgi:cobalamin synthase
MKDPRQGAAAIVFLIFYLFAFAFTLFCLFTRRAKRHIFSVFIFNVIRIGANIASLGWAIHLYENFDWFIASLILGTEGECWCEFREAKLIIRVFRPRPWYPVSTSYKSVTLLMIGSSLSDTRKRPLVPLCSIPIFLKVETNVSTDSPMSPSGSNGVSA